MDKVENDSKESVKLSRLSRTWDYEKEELTPAILNEIVRNLASYAYDVTCYESRENDVAPGDGDNSLYVDFQVYCHIVKDHFETAVKEALVKEAPGSVRDKLRQIAEEAFGLIDKLLEYVDKRLYAPSATGRLDSPYSLTDLSNQWNTIVRRFDLYTATGGRNSEDRQENETHWVESTADGIELTVTERNILEALGRKTMRGPELLSMAGYDNSSHYRTILSNLVKRGILRKKQNGYSANGRCF